MISVRNLTKRFGEFVAVDRVEFEVEAGEVMGFLGPNGAGKTTTLRILTGYLPATSGTVLVNGKDVLRESLQVRRLLGYLPEQVPLYLDMRVEEYLRFRGLLKGIPRKEIQRRVGEAVESCGLVPMTRRIVGQLSKGYRQRVGLADALVSRPKILILDEPTGGLDPHQRKEVLELIKQLAEQHTILLSSHVLAEVETISDRVMIIQQGKLLTIGRPHELADQLQEAPRIQLEVRCDETRAETVIRGTLGEQLEAIEFETVSDEWIRVRLQTGGDEDFRAPINEAFVKEGLGVRELIRQAFTLEELFLRITAQSAQEAVR